MMDKLELVQPDIRYRDSYVEALREGLEPVMPPEEKLHEIERDFEGYRKREHDLNNPVVLPDGSKVKRIPHTELWLVSGDRFLGRISIRHELTEYLRQVGGHIGYAVRKSERRKGYGKLMMKLALPYARLVGLKEALVTCDDDNIASIKIIEGAGGVLEKLDRMDVFATGEPLLVRHYWVKL
ncbi:MAG: GNAT family N-acetyltransferase [Pseudomonadota bacterium]